MPINTVGVTRVDVFWRLSDRVCCPFSCTLSIIEIRYIKVLRTHLVLSVHCVYHMVQH